MATKKNVFNDKKPWYKSKTIWTQILAVIVGITTVIQGQLEAGVTITAFGVLNGYLRTITKSEVTK